MVSDKDIKIAIQTVADITGAEKAATAINKVDKAADAAGGQLGKASGKSADVAKVLKQTAAAADTAGNSSRTMGAKVQNMSYQLADVAVQLEMGTSAARAFTQQGSQMLAVLGPWGAIAGAALAIGGAIFSASESSEEAKDAITEDAEEMSEGMKALKQFADDAADALEMDRLGASTEAFAARIKAVDDLNKSLSEQLAISRQLRDIELQKQDAEAAAQIAEIEASDAPKNEQAQQVSAIRAGLQQRARQRELDAIREKELNADKDIEAAKAKEAAAAVKYDSDLNEKIIRQAAFDEERAALENQTENARKAAEEVEEQKIRRNRILLTYGTEGGGEAGERSRNKSEKGLADALAKQEAIKTLTPEEFQAALKYNEEAAANLESARAALKEAQKEVAKATGKAADVKRLGGAQRDLIETQGGSAARISESQRIAEERSAREAEQERFARGKKRRAVGLKRSKPEDKKTRDDLTGEETSLTEAADRSFEGARGSRFFAPVEEARKALENGGTGEEYGMLAQEMENFVAAVTGIDAKKKADISALAQKFRDLAERVKRLETE